MQMLKKFKNLDSKKQIILGVMGIIIGVSILSFNYLKEKKDNVFTKMNLELYNQEIETIAYNEEQNYQQSEEVVEQVETEIMEEELSQQENTEPVATTTAYNYIGTLEIPKISFKKGFLDIYSENNTVSKNIEVIKTSNYPDVEKGNFIIAGHSGNSSVAYFKDLYQLVVGDIAYVEYDGNKYTYQITNIYTQQKTGTIGIYRDYEKTTLTLVTCTKDDKTTQTIYIAQLVNKESL